MYSNIQKKSAKDIFFLVYFKIYEAVTFGYYVSIKSQIIIAVLNQKKTH
jgi:hypothetical protein